MLTTAKNVDQFLILQSKSLSELVAIGLSLGIELVDSPASKDKDKVITLIMGAQEANKAYSADKPQAISLRTSINGQVINGGAAFLREIRLKMYRYNKRKEFTLINPKDAAYQQQMNYLPCELEDIEKIRELNMLLAKPEQEDLYNMILTDQGFLQFEVNFINKPSNDGKSFVMLHINPK